MAAKTGFVAAIAWPRMYKPRTWANTETSDKKLRLNQPSSSSLALNAPNSALATVSRRVSPSSELYGASHLGNARKRRKASSLPFGPYECSA